MLTIMAFVAAGSGVVALVGWALAGSAFEAGACSGGSMADVEVEGSFCSTAGVDSTEGVLDNLISFDSLCLLAWFHQYHPQI
jgi:hypothetical protein